MITSAVSPAETGIAAIRSSSPSPGESGWDWLSVVSVMIGALMYVSFQIGGQIFGGEMLILAISPILAYDRFYLKRSALETQRSLWVPICVLLGGLALTSIGYLLSDLYRNNAAADFLRGWARLFFLGLDLLVMAMLISVRRANLWLIAIGYGFGGALLLLAQGLPLVQWKLGYGEPVTLGCIALSCLIKSVNYRGLALLSLGGLNVLWDYRSLAVFCLVAAVVGWLNLWAQGGRAKIVRGVVLVAVLTALMGIGYYATQGTFAERRQASNSVRLSSALVGFSAVLESPLIGYGSWGKDTRFAKQFADVQFRMNKSEENPLYDFDLIRLATIPAHSQFLEAWIEGGIFGIAFMMCYLVFLVRGIRALFAMQSASSTITMMGFFMINGLWALFMSPFKGFTRIDIALACLSAIITLQMAAERSKPVAVRQVSA
jgi:O-antigen ligase